MLANKPIEVSAAVVIHENKVLMAKRTEGYLNNLLEFPGGKLEKNESPQDAAKRELKEELNIDIEPKNIILTLEHSYPDKSVKLHFVRCFLSKETNKNLEIISKCNNANWFYPKEINTELLCPADAKAYKEINWDKLFVQNETSNNTNEHPLILVINPGSRTTKIAIFRELELINEKEITHTPEELAPFKQSYQQLDYRYNAIIKALNQLGYQESDFNAIIGRGGTLKPVESGVYAVNKSLIDDIKNGGAMDHASLLGGLISDKIAKKINVPAFIADPVSVDEFDDVARISGTPLIPRRSLVHALNMKAVAEEVAEADEKNIEEVNYIIAHLGGGFSISPMRKGKLIDVNDSNEGGPMTPERCGTIPLVGTLKLCFSGKYDYSTLFKTLIGKGGLYAYLGTADCREIERMIDSGNEKAKLCLDAMSYQISKEIGGAAAALKGQVDKIILTGGVAFCKLVVDYITDHVSFIAPVISKPGQNEMKALARHAYRALKNPSIVKIY